MDRDERELLAQATAQALAGAGSDGSDDADRALADLGWADMLEAETDEAIDVVFRALGHANATSSALDDVVLHALGLAGADLAVVLPAFGSWRAPGGAGIATSRATTATTFAVVRPDGSVHAVPAEHVALERIVGADPWGRWHRAHADTRHRGGSTAPGIPAWTNAVALAQRAVAAEISGALRAQLALACEHATTRVQFDRPIASFQAVRHKLAEALVAIEALDACLGAAIDEPNPTTAALAKAVAGRSARTVAAHCQQVLAGIGFTVDHSFHRYLKRVMVLEGLFGTAETIATALGHELLAKGRVPTLIEL